MRRRTYRCPNCGSGFMSSRSLVRHLLEEAGPRGVTTGEFIRAGVGSRYSARVYELRHEEGLEIVERKESESSHRYTLAHATRASGPDLLRCGYDGHEWRGTCRRDQFGYPLIDGAEPACPKCHRTAYAVEGDRWPARPAVTAKAAA